MSRSWLGSWFPHGKVLVTLAVAISLAAGCGSKSGPAPSATTPTKPTESVYTYLRDIVTRAAVGDPDLEPIVSAACTAYADGVEKRSGDSASFDQWVADLFDVNEGGLEQSRVDSAVTKACDAFDGDVRGFADDLSASLGLGLDKLRRYVANACAGFEQRRRVNATDPNAPEPFDPLVSDVFANGGLDRPDLTALVDTACREFPVGNPAPPASSATTPP